ncbi:hypothetical protein MCHK_3024 [Mesorhizobium huakuii 7653R]|nr:hypothetical protein MCHK_3024 [Mesorhizobium huakuii 7653R]
MSTFTRFAYADVFAGQYKDRPTFIQSLLGRLQIEARHDGWPGTAIVDADWIEKTGQPPMAVIQLMPGNGDVSVADVRMFLVEKRRKQLKLIAQEDAA